MNELEIAQAIHSLIYIVSKGNVTNVIQNWKFEIVSVIQNSHIICVSKLLQDGTNITDIETYLTKYCQATIKFKNLTTMHKNNYIIAYL